MEWWISLAHCNPNEKHRGHFHQLVRHVGVLVAPVQPGDGTVEQRQVGMGTRWLILKRLDSAGVLWIQWYFYIQAYMSLQSDM